MLTEEKSYQFICKIKEYPIYAKDSKAETLQLPTEVTLLFCEQ